MAAILSSAMPLETVRGLSGRSTQTPTRPFPDVTPDIELTQRGDHPAFKLLDKTAHVMTALAHVQHHIDHALARPMIGVLATALAFINRKPVRIGQVFALGRGACSVERRVFDQPYALFADPAEIAAARSSMKATA